MDYLSCLNLFFHMFWVGNFENNLVLCCTDTSDWKCVLVVSDTDRTVTFVIRLSYVTVSGASFVYSVLFSLSLYIYIYIIFSIKKKKDWVMSYFQNFIGVNVSVLVLFSVSVSCVPVSDVIISFSCWFCLIMHTGKRKSKSCTTQVTSRWRCR